MRFSLRNAPRFAIIVILLSLGTAFAQPATAPVPPPPSPPQTTQPPSTQPPSAQSREAWQTSMSQTPLPKHGCFKSSYPNLQWQEVPCTTAPQRPYPPATGVRPDTVGNGNDFTASVSDGHISSVVGSFDSVSGVTGATDAQGASPFSLQLNTNSFTTSSCSGATNPAGCLGWQQFIFSNSGAVFMQYWLLNFGPTCPSGWAPFQNSCWHNSDAQFVPVQAIANLSQLRLTGSAFRPQSESACLNQCVVQYTNCMSCDRSQPGCPLPSQCAQTRDDCGSVCSNGTDSAIISTPDGVFGTAGPDSVLDLASGWQAAEFNVFGDCCGTQSNFNAGSTIVVRVSVNSGSTSTLPCVTQGFTGETTNLTLVPPCSSISGPAQAIVFTERVAAAPPPNPTCIARCTQNYEACLDCDRSRGGCPLPSQCAEGRRACDAAC